MERIAIFFDTNKLESRFTDHKCGSLCVSDIKATKDFYDIKKFIEDNRLCSNVDLCIPEIVILEYKRHLLEIYTMHTKSFKDTINEYQKVFGSILNVEFEFAKRDINEFQGHVDALLDNFIEINNCKVIEYDRSSTLLERIVDKAINRVAPFAYAKSKGKEYHDAGFKDTIIAETILKYRTDNGCPCILISEDNDWGRCLDLNQDHIFICKDLEHLKNVLSKKWGILESNDVRLKFEDSYIQETIIQETGNRYDKSVSEFNITDIALNDENIYVVKINCKINETSYTITCEYDDSSNAVSNVVYKIENE